MTSLNLSKRDAYEDKFGQMIAKRLSASTDSIPHDISERLKAARMQALSKRKVVKPQLASGTSGHGGVLSLHMGDNDRSLWNRIASLLPLLALIAGLVAIAVVAEDDRVKELADIDAQLLTDELPPDAYTDPGFAQFLRTNPRD
jgi:hypothetical protein